MSKVEELIAQFNAKVEEIAGEQEAVLAGNKAAGLRLRKATLSLEKITKNLRAATIEAEKK